MLMYKSIIQAPLQIQEDNLVAVRVSPVGHYIRDKLYVFERFLANNASRD